MMRRDWQTGGGRHWELVTCIRRTADGWMWRVRYNATEWKGGPLADKRDAVNAVRKRFDEIILTQSQYDLTNHGT